MKSNRWNIILAILTMFMSISFIVTTIIPSENISRGVSGVVALFYMLSSILYFCTYILNKKRIEKDKEIFVILTILC